MANNPASSEETVTGDFEEFFRENYSSLWRFVARRLPPSMVDDIVSTSFVVAWGKFASVNNPALPWLYRIATYEVSNARRKQRREGLRITSVEFEEVAAPRAETFDGSLVRSAMAVLSESDQEILRLVLWDELHREDIGRVLGITTNAVNVRFHRALKNFERSAVVPPHLYPVKEATNGQ
jgi:RNA polymerase sigma-70 factor (ECF subfamily)